MEWDTAAAHAVAAAAGRRVRNYRTGAELAYNKENLLNDWFIVE
jgi:3'(2'), 5'-bisphosphate nucleotidase